VCAAAAWVCKAGSAVPKCKVLGTRFRDCGGDALRDSDFEYAVLEASLDLVVGEARWDGDGAAKGAERSLGNLKWDKCRESAKEHGFCQVEI
jgi:hypothetical protein